MGILVIGSILMDIKGYPEGNYLPNGRNQGNVVRIPGGVARNIAQDLGNLGFPATLLSVGEDSGEGRSVLQALLASGVDISRIPLHVGGMGVWMAIFDESGNVVGSITKRPDLTPLEEVLDREGDALLEEAESVILCVDITPAIASRVLTIAEKHGKKVFGVVANMGLALQNKGLFPSLAGLICNEQEAGQLMGWERSQGSEGLQRKLRQEKIRAMIVTLGERGCVYADTVQHGACPAKKTRVVDTTGAGDAFCAAAAAALTTGKSLSESCRLGAALASKVLSRVENTCPATDFNEL